MGISFEPLTASIGAVVHGVDLADVDADTVEEIRKGWLDYQVLFFRDQPITVAQHIAFGRRWGELEIHPFAPDDGEHPELVVIESNEERKYAASNWHSDVTWRTEPSLGSILRGRIIPPAGGDTVFASATKAYDRLSDEWKERVDGLVAEHDFANTFGRRMSSEKLAETHEKYPVAY
ncbi:MAG: taurine dioxygenase, partial [Acidimicrobiales bacterium]|nr:taurine dioxygenase [Acidimicrobiales bacterium]